MRTLHVETPQGGSPEASGKTTRNGEFQAKNSAARRSLQVLVFSPFCEMLVGTVVGVVVAWIVGGGL